MPPDYTCLECGEPIEELPPATHLDGSPIPPEEGRYHIAPRPYNRLCFACRIAEHGQVRQEQDEVQDEHFGDISDYWDSHHREKARGEYYD